MTGNFICFNTRAVYVCSRLVTADYFSAHVATVVFFLTENKENQARMVKFKSNFLMSLQIWNCLPVKNTATYIKGIMIKVRIGR